MKKIIGLLTITASLTACAPMVWNKPGATEQSFRQDEYQCLQQSSYRQETVRQVYAGNNTYAPVYDNKIVQDRGMFKSCMMAKGYSLGK